MSSKVGVHPEDIEVKGGSRGFSTVIDQVKRRPTDTTMTARKEEPSAIERVRQRTIRTSIFKHRIIDNQWPSVR